MPHVRLTRHFHFSASHRLHAPALSAEENRRVFGKCNNPHGHGHNYVLGVTVEGEVNLVTGQVVHPGELEAVVRAAVLDDYSYKYLDQDLADFATMTATAENMASNVRDRLLAAWPAGFPALAQVRIQETKRNVIDLPVIEETV
ncbi:MAG: 6-carboxytetrahydropterin synthase [Bryobacterales bacterium]|nr:6-carboxytetrahydropterin synthase [Bryobacterales bacterium]